MINKNIKVSTLQYLLLKKYGTGWVDLEPETIMADLNFPDYLVLEKIYILTALSKGLNETLKLADFVTWASSICNNDFAEFEYMEFPNSLELAWMLVELKRVGALTGQPFLPTEELIDIISYFLKMEGFSKPIAPFNFIPATKLHPGQTEEDTMLKAKGIESYIDFMDKNPAVIDE